MSPCRAEFIRPAVQNNIKTWPYEFGPTEEMRRKTSTDFESGRGGRDCARLALHITHSGLWRPLPQPVLHRLECALRTAGRHRDTAVRQVAHLTVQAKSKRMLTGRGTKKHALHTTGYDALDTGHAG
jgi:hypothetical protein